MLTDALQEQGTHDYMNKVIARALEYFDLGEKEAALDCFFSAARSNLYTAWVEANPSALPLLTREYDRGRDAFEQAMCSFRP